MKTVGLMLASNNVEFGRSYAYMVKACKDTWIAEGHPDVTVHAVYGKEDSDKTGPQNLKVVDGDIIVDTIESRENLLGKTISAMAWALQAYPEAQFFFRPNCGSYINLRLLGKFLSDKPTRGFYCGPDGEYHGIPYVQGACMIFSRDLVELMVGRHAEMIMNGLALIDDVAVGLFMAQKGVARALGQAQRINAKTIDILNKNFTPDCYHYWFQHTINPALIYHAHQLTTIR